MVATKYYNPQSTPSTVASFESGGVQRKYSWMSSGTNSIESSNSNMHYYQTASCPATPGGAKSPNNHRNCAPFSYATTPVVTPRNDPPVVSIAPRSSPSGSKENHHHYSVNQNNIMQPQLTQDDKLYQQRNDSNSAKETHQRPFADTGNNNSTESPDSPSKADFAKSQAELNRSYRQRMARFNRLTVAARKETGRNLKNLRPLAIRTAEFC